MPALTLFSAGRGNERCAVKRLSDGAGQGMRRVWVSSSRRHGNVEESRFLEPINKPIVEALEVDMLWSLQSYSSEAGP